MTPGDDDPFGRKGEEETDAFGRPIREGEAATSTGSLWSGHADERPPPPVRDAAPTGGFLPPTDAGVEEPVRWEPPGGDTTPGTPATGEAAEYLERAGAAFIDFCIRAAIAIGVLIVVAVAAGGGEDASAAALLIGYYVIAPLYAPLAMTRWEGQTIGHRAVNTRIVSRKGDAVTGGRAFAREVGAKYLVVEVIGGGLSLGIFTLVNYLWPLWDRRNEALHDKMCDTRVVKA